MKRLFVFVLIPVLLLIGLVYVIIPEEIKVSSIKIASANERAVYRNLINEQNWKKWWPFDENENDQLDSSRVYLDGYEFKTATKQLDGMEVIIINRDQSTSSLLNLSPLSNDSTMISWTANVSTPGNPFSRLSNYFKAKRIKESMETILKRLKAFTSNSENLYGINVKETRVVDTLLMVMKKEQKEKPSETGIYSNVSFLKQYIASAGGKETDHPMLNTSYSNTTKKYTITVAIPVNKRLPENDSIKLKRMVPGNILFADVKGGTATVGEATKQMENYVFDHHRTSPAMPFQLLVTDRTKEKDTTKWLTRIYYPVL